MAHGRTWFSWKGEDLVLHLHVQPRSNKDSFGEIHDHRLKLRLTAPPVDGKANQHLIAFLARQFGIPKSAVEITSGEGSRLKSVVLRRPARMPENLDFGAKTAKNC